MTITDKDLGEIKLVKNDRAKKIIVKYREGQFLLTYPPAISISCIEKTIEEMKPRLLKLRERRLPEILFFPDIKFNTFSFELKLIENSVTDNYYLNLKNGILSISYPSGVNLENNDIQMIIKSHIEKIMRYEANRIFPQKVRSLSEKYNFLFNKIKINKSRHRWGSCSSKKDINLSFYMMLLPEYLVDFVILHELCHTIEMNHGKNFWSLLDKVTNGRAKELTRELNEFKVNW